MPQVLVVDDSLEIGELIASYLYEQRYVVVTVNRGAAALRALASRSFDAIVADVMLPDISGLELAEVASKRGIPVILISGEPKSIKDLTGGSRHTFLQKPFRLVELELVLRSLVQAETNVSNIASPFAA